MPAYSHPSPYRPPAIPADFSAMREDLQNHHALCDEVLAVVERESQALRQPAEPDTQPLRTLRQSLLPRLTQSLDRLRQHRQRWQQLSPAEKARHPEIGPLLRQNQNLIMKIIVLDRENEQVLLRRGMLPPQHLPPSQRQRPNFITELYRRQGK